MISHVLKNHSVDDIYTHTDRNEHEMSTDLHLQQLSIAAKSQERNILARTCIPDVNAKTVNILKTFTGSLDKYKTSLTRTNHAVHGTLIDHCIHDISHADLV